MSTTTLHEVYTALVKAKDASERLPSVATSLHSGNPTMTVDFQALAEDITSLVNAYNAFYNWYWDR